ncbi:MAG TPA: pantoate--beta-alanine ligase [bacterium]|nr:pantoate--beta-alanine ligase [bacterium]
MMVIRTSGDMELFAKTARKAGKKIAFVPTMGALHAGHQALFREARKHGDVVVASIYVNPRQFNDPEDFQKYARDLEGDLKKCEKEGVDAVFAPTDSDVYPAEDSSSEIPVPEVASRLEGASRPGHFDGVVAVVSRLFRIVHPHTAIFGLKDYQQVRVIEEMVAQQKMDVAILRHPTVREKDGLAMSSRNVRLTPQGRQKALIISKALKAAQYLFEKGERDAAVIRKKVEGAIVKEGLQIDYVAIVDATTLEDLPVIDRHALLAVAVFIDGVRLIDNGLLG